MSQLLSGQEVGGFIEQDEPFFNFDTWEIIVTFVIIGVGIFLAVLFLPKITLFKT